MQSPDDVCNAIVDILGRTILRIRASGWEHDAKRCAVETDHVHNLPRLLTDYYDIDALEYYLNAERPSYVDDCKRLDATPENHADAWQRLDEYVANHPE